MEIKILELTTDLAKTAMQGGAGGHIANPDNLAKFLEVVSKKLDQLWNAPTGKS